MRLRLESKFAKLLTFIVVAVLLLPYGYVAWSRYRAAQVALSEDRESLQRAVDLQPGDAAYQERLARYILFVDQDAIGALGHYRMAAVIDPYSARSWLGVAQSQLILGDSNSALRAIDQAVEVDPHTPSVRWEAGNLLVALGQPARAMQQFRFTMENDPTMVGQALQLIRRMGSPAQAAKLALPPNPYFYREFINMLIQAKDLDGARQVWSQLIALKKPFDPKWAFFYIETLAVTGDLDGIARAWADLEQISPDVARLHQGNNVIHNAGFEYPILDGGLDWIVPPTSNGPLLQNDVSTSHEGRRCLMVSFDGSRPSEVGIRQLLLLEPNSHYRFSGYMKGNLQTANGLNFSILDVNASKFIFQTSDVIDGQKWTELSGDFHTGPEKHLYHFMIGRTGTTLIRGTAWIDDLHLVKESQ